MTTLCNWCTEPLPHPLPTAPISYYFSNVLLLLSFLWGRLDWWNEKTKQNKKQKNKTNFIHWTRTFKSSFMALGISRMLCTWTNICSVAQTEDCSLWKDWWLLPELEPFISGPVDCKRGWLAGFPGPCLLKDFTIIILGQNEGFTRILRRPSLVFATSMPPFSALGSNTYYGGNSLLLKFIVYVNFLMFLLRLPALTPALKLASSLLCLNLTELPRGG